MFVAFRIALCASRVPAVTSCRVVASPAPITTAPRIASVISVQTATTMPRRRTPPAVLRRAGATEADLRDPQSIDFFGTTGKVSPA